MPVLPDVQPAPRLVEFRRQPGACHYIGFGRIETAIGGNENASVGAHRHQRTQFNARGNTIGNILNLAREPRLEFMCNRAAIGLHQRQVLAVG